MTWFQTEPLDIIDAPADEHHKGGRTVLIPRRIVIHATAGTNSLRWLTRQSIPEVSVHRLIARDGRIYKLGEDWEVMYHVGHATMFPHPFIGLTNANYTSLGIELENTNDGTQEYTSSQLASAAGQVVEWIGQFGYIPVVSHADLDARKHDPFRFPWEQFMVLVWDRITSMVDH